MINIASICYKCRNLLKIIHEKAFIAPDGIEK